MHFLTESQLMKALKPKFLDQMIRIICNNWPQYKHVKPQDIEAQRDKQAYLQSLDQKES